MCKQDGQVKAKVKVETAFREKFKIPLKNSASKSSGF
jgi:hypothetical protein